MLPYTSDDIVVAKRLIDAGASAVMPLVAPIGSGWVCRTRPAIQDPARLITDVPLIVDARRGHGLGRDHCDGAWHGWRVDEYRNRCGRRTRC